MEARLANAPLRALQPHNPVLLPLGRRCPETITNRENFACSAEPASGGFKKSLGGGYVFVLPGWYLSRMNTPGFGFKDRKLYVFMENRIIILEAWPSLKALRKEGDDTWEEFTPRFRVLFDESIGPGNDEEAPLPEGEEFLRQRRMGKNDHALGCWRNLVELPEEVPRTQASELTKPDRQLPRPEIGNECLVRERHYGIFGSPRPSISPASAPAKENIGFEKKWVCPASGFKRDDAVDFC